MQAQHVFVHCFANWGVEQTRVLKVVAAAKVCALKDRNEGRELK